MHSLLSLKLAHLQPTLSCLQRGLRGVCCRLGQSPWTAILNPSPIVSWQSSAAQSIAGPRGHLHLYQTHRSGHVSVMPWVYQLVTLAPKSPRLGLPVHWKSPLSIPPMDSQPSEAALFFPGIVILAKESNQGWVWGKHLWRRKRQKEPRKGDPKATGCLCGRHSEEVKARVKYTFFYFSS